MISINLVGVICGLLLIQSITAQCHGPRLPGPLAYAPEISSTGSFAVRSTSPISPTGVKVLSDQLVIEGPLVIDGNLPFLGTVALEGKLASTGAGNVAHSCGGPVGISSEITPVAGGVGTFGPGSGRIGPRPLGPATLGSGMVGPATLGPVSLGPGMVGSPLGRGFGLGSGRVY